MPVVDDEVVEDLADGLVRQRWYMLGPENFYGEVEQALASGEDLAFEDGSRGDAAVRDVLQRLLVALDARRPWPPGWRGWVNGLTYGLIFVRDIDDGVVEETAEGIVEQRTTSLPVQYMYDAAARGLESGADLSSYHGGHDHVAIRGFLQRLLVALDARRPWPPIWRSRVNGLTRLIFVRGIDDDVVRNKADEIVAQITTYESVQDLYDAAVQALESGVDLASRDGRHDDAAIRSYLQRLLVALDDRRPWP